MEWDWVKYSRLLRFYAALTIVLVVGGCGTHKLAKACFQEERAALMEFKAFLEPHKKNILPSWVISTDCCDWERVTCDPASGRVVRLSLHFLCAYQCPDRFNFSLFIPFKELRTLNLSRNWFNHGVFTQDYGGTPSLKMLQTLDLSYCAFKLTIVKLFSSFESLKTLLLTENNLDGPFPLQELLALRNLEQLDLSGNGLESPSKNFDFKRMSALKKLETLDLSYNQIFQNSSTASIFKSLSPIKSLKNLALGSTNLEGPLPVHDLSLLQNLETLDLRGNRLTSPSTTADSKALSRLKRLRTLDLSYNAFDERIIKFLSDLSALRTLLLFHGGITGNVDDKGICKLKNLQELDLRGNNFTGTLSSFSCLRNLTSLRALDLSDNYLSGNISSLSFVARDAPLEYLSLSDNNLEGTFSLSSLANYSELKVLRLGGMYNKNFQVETENPPWVPSFQLRHLEIADCQLKSATTGTIPAFLSHQRGLTYIDLSNSNLVGGFPNWLIVNNPKLERVFLNDNSLNGSFLLPSDEDQQMDHLNALDISQNKIQGKLPTTLGFFFKNLIYLNASGNVLDGDIPASIGEMSFLKILDLANNNLSGELPDDMIRGCISLQLLSLSHNRFRGRVVWKHSSMTSLSIVLMGNNRFDGTLEMEDGWLGMKNLKVLDISNNLLSGELPSWIGNLTLEVLFLSGNNLEGAIPTELCKIEEIEQIEIVSLSNNRFSGAIPSCLGNTSSLSVIHLRNNSLTGTIPESLFRSSNLFSVDLGDNSFSGSIPKSVSGLTSLMFLSLAGNRLRGQLPSQICELKELNYLDLSRNNFTGSIPACFNNISFGNAGYYSSVLDGYLFVTSWFANLDDYDVEMDYLYPDFDLNPYNKDIGYRIRNEMQFTTKGSSLSFEGNIFKYMSGLDLSCNQLAGKIPQQIGDLVALHALNLSHNNLDGSIPESFQKLKVIESLDLSFNRLSGPIPLQLQDLNYLSVFNVSYNNLSGRAPDKGQFGTFDESCYRGNPYLSWNISNRGIATPTSLPPAATLNDEESNSVIDLTSFWWTFAASFVTVISTFIAILWINPHWRRLWFYFIEDCLYKCLGGLLKDAFY